MEVARSSEMLISYHNTTQHHNPDDLNLYKQTKFVKNNNTKSNTWNKVSSFLTLKISVHSLQHASSYILKQKKEEPCVWLFFSLQRRQFMKGSTVRQINICNQMHPLVSYHIQTVFLVDNIWILLYTSELRLTDYKY
jgi:hypothetical protein